MVASMKVYSTNTASTGNDLESISEDGKFIQMGPGGSATGYYDNNGNYQSGGGITPGDVTHTIDHMIETANDAADDIRGKDREQERAEGASEYGFYYGTDTGLKPIYNPTPNTIKAPGTPTAYSRTSARTATDIAQGGMTKQEVQEFNKKHPNETVMRGQ